MADSTSVQPFATNIGATEANKAFDTGQNAINSFDPNALKNSFISGINSLTGSQLGGGPSNAQDFMKQYQNTLGGFYNTANSMFNVPALAQNATTLQNQVLQTPQRTLDTARGFNYDQNQVNNQVALTLGRLSPLASAATNQAQTAQQLANQFINTNIAPTQFYGQQMNDILARQATGYTTAMQNEYEGLLNKMQQGIALSGQELTRANQLATYAQAYNTTVLSTRYQQPGLMNTYTGQILGTSGTTTPLVPASTPNTTPVTTTPAVNLSTVTGLNKNVYGPSGGLAY